MALDFTGTAGDLVDHSSDTSIDDVNPFTLCSWVYVTTLAGRIFTKGFLGVHGMYHFHGFLAATDQIGFEWQGVTSGILRSQATATNFTHYGTSKWMFWVHSGDSGGATTDQKQYVGDLNNDAAEPSSYTIQQLTVGGARSDAAAPLIVGNRAAASTDPWGGYIATLMLFDSVLTPDQIHAQQYSLVPLFSGSKLSVNYGWNGTGTQVDWSGNKNHGTVTGATVANHVPLGYVPHSAAKILQAEGRVAPFIMSRPGIV